MVWNDVDEPPELMKPPSPMLAIPEHNVRLAESWNVTLTPSTGVEAEREMVTGNVTHGFEGQMYVAVDCASITAADACARPALKAAPVVATHPAITAAMARSRVLELSQRVFTGTSLARGRNGSPPASRWRCISF